MASGFSLKDQLFNAEKVAGLADRFGAASSDFDGAAFQADVMSRMLDLELKERIAWIAECLIARLPDALEDAGPILVAALPEPLDPTLTDDDFGDFIYAPFGDVVVALGLEQPGPALALIEEITQRFSMEWAVRPFLNRWPDETLATFHGWSGHPNYHVRRLVSEGTRPRLPWGQGITLPIETALPLLDKLHGDPTRYVTRSVANHMNDVAKKDPDLAMDRLTSWRGTGKQAEKELGWMTSHALRGLVKAGNARAMVMLGYDPDAAVELTALSLPKTARIGDAVAVEFTLTAPEKTPVLVDYVFSRPRADGKMSEKVHKVKQAVLRAGTPMSFAKTHRLKGDATTYRLFPGTHRIDVQVNGRILGGADLEVTEA
ncbi:MAG: hypothetical protein AAGA94_04885 [Pseudomonadota bacterium]